MPLGKRMLMATSGSVFNPLSLSPFLWLDASDSATLFQDTAKTTPATDEDHAVKAWADKSGNGYDVLEETSNPTLALAAVNGKNAVEFTTAHKMKTATFSGGDVAQPRTIYVAFTINSTYQNRTLIDGIITGKRHFVKYSASAPNADFTINSGSFLGTSELESLVMTADETFVVTFLANGASSALYRNGVEILAGNAGTNALSGLSVGAVFTYAAQFGGNMCEIIAVPQASDVTERATVTAYLADKWGANLPANIEITSPVSYEVIQRSGTTADIAITGAFGHQTITPTAIEARWNGGSWVTLDASPQYGLFSGTLSSQTQGQGDLEVRFANDTSITATTSYVGIGDVFVIAGQSNASGRGTNNQTYTHATLKAGLFGNDYEWHELYDPSDDSTGQIDSVSLDTLEAGSVWLLLATSFMADQSVPVAFIPCAFGGTAVSEWEKGTDNDRSTLYGSMQYRVGQMQNGVKAVLWWQGERDAVLGTAEATYNTALDGIANNINTDLSCKLMPCKIEDLSTYGIGYDETAVNNAISTAWGDNANVLTGPDFSDITPSVDGVHFKTDGELATAASRWWTALQAALYP